jgi:hypothetical protein
MFYEYLQHIFDHENGAKIKKYKIEEAHTARA